MSIGCSASLIPKASKYDLAMLHCVGCQKTPSQIKRYRVMSAIDGRRASIHVWEKESTLYRETGAFLCDACWHACRKLNLNKNWVASPVNVPEVQLLMWGPEDF